MATTPVQITLSDLTAKVNAGWKKPALAQHYGIPVSQMTSALQSAGLRIRKLHHPKYQLVDDTQDTAAPSITQSPLEAALMPETIDVTETMETEVAAEVSTTQVESPEEATW